MDDLLLATRSTLKEEREASCEEIAIDPTVNLFIWRGENLRNIDFGFSRFSSPNPVVTTANLTFSADTDELSLRLQLL